jgi:hypothetical protein
MQEKSNTPLTAKCQTNKEARRLHVENWKKSGLSMSDYCRQNNLALSNLSGWKQSLLRASTSFKSIKVLSKSEPERPTSNTIEIIVDHRIKIRLQHVTDASLVINIAKGLLTCS